MLVSKRWTMIVATVVLLPISTAAGAVHLKFNGDDVPGDIGYFDGTSPTNYNAINWDEDLIENGEALGLEPNTLDGVNGQNILDAIDFLTGAATGINLTVTSDTGWNSIGPNRSGTFSPGSPASDFFDGEATDSSLFGHTSNFNIGSPRPLVEYTIAGLSPTGLYDFTFFAAREEATENRETQYDVAGANSAVGFLNPSDNLNNIAQALQVQPTTAGELTLTIQPGPNNLNSDGFFYLGAFEILENGSASANEPGDFSADGFVSQGDLDLVLLNWGVTVPPAPVPNGWVNDQPVGLIGQGVLDKVLLNWGNGTPTVSASATTVPEPTTAALLLSVCCVVCMRRRHIQS